MICGTKNALATLKGTKTSLNNLLYQKNLNTIRQVFKLKKEKIVTSKVDKQPPEKILTLSFLTTCDAWSHVIARSNERAGMRNLILAQDCKILF